MKKHFQILQLVLSALLLSARLLPAQEPQAMESVTGVISVPLANVHRLPAPKSGLVTQVLMADEVRVLEKQEYRYRISIPGQGGLEGWVQQEAVLVPKDGAGSYLDKDRTWVVIAVPKTDALILDRTGDHKIPLYGGIRLPVLEKTGELLKVQFPDRSIAMISEADTVPLKSPDPLVNGATPEDIANTAKRFAGVRYKQSGLTAQGMDTSGLVYIVYRIHGYPGRPGTGAFEGRAERVGKKDLLPGDILVFHGEGEGLYVGSGRFLRSSPKSSIQAAGIHDSRYARSFRYGLRVIGTDPFLKKTLPEMTADEILSAQTRIAGLPVGKRIAYWAERFIGTPYDPDPLGLYVRTNRIIADEKVDCMYHTFRSVELAQSATPEGAVTQALSLRFVTQGQLAEGLVANYDERFEYGEDMVFSGKWGRNVTAELDRGRTIPGSRGREEVVILPKAVLLGSAVQKKLQDGDIVFWVKDPNKRSPAEEIVAHLSIVRVRAGRPYVIHASGDKDRNGKPGGGVVKELPFSEYVRNMRFIGAFVTRFDQQSSAN